MNRKRRNHISGIKPVSTLIPHRINQVIIKEFTLTTLNETESHSHREHGCHRCGVGVSDERSNEREKEKEEFQEKFHKDE